MFGINEKKEHARLAAFVEDAEARLNAPDEQLYATAPHVSKWSVAQQLHHAMMVNEQALEQLLMYCEGQGEGRTGDINMVGRLVLMMGRIPRGRGRSPKPFVPAEQPTREALHTLVTQMDEHTQALVPHLGTLRNQEGQFKHPVFGYLNAAQWLRFARIHALHHLTIIRDIEKEHAKTNAEETA